MTKKEIYEQITSEFVQDANIQSLYNLNPNLSYNDQFSKFSFETILFNFIASILVVYYFLFKEHKEEIENRALEIQSGNTRWYAEQAKLFQFSDNLVWNQDALRFEYQPINELNRIVTYASATDLGNSVIVKVAKDNDGFPEKLSPIELNRVQVYMNQIKFAGTILDVVSRDPDELRLSMEVYADPLVLNNDGSLLSDPSVFPVENAINDYLSNLDFDAIYTNTSLIDRIQEQPGVLNPILTSTEARFGTQAYQPIGSFYQSNAGYMVIDPNSPLSASINYIFQ